MAYSDSPKTLEKIRPLLLNLELGRGDTFVPAPGVSAKQLAYKIREALHIASLYPEKYPQLAKAARTFKVKIVTPRKVEAVLTDKQTGLPGISEGGAGGTTQGLEGEHGTVPLKVMGQQTAASIIEHILRVQTLQPNNGQFSYPEANLNMEEKTRLHTWCSKQTPPWIMLVADERITVSRRTRTITEDIGWSPEDGED